MMYAHDGTMWFGGGFMWLFWILIIVAIVVAVKFVVGGSPGSSSSGNSESAMDILKRRYAEGEIDEAEFERRSKQLKK